MMFPTTTSLPSSSASTTTTSNSNSSSSSSIGLSILDRHAVISFIESKGTTGATETQIRNRWIGYDDIIITSLLKSLLEDFTIYDSNGTFKVL
mmetsp:Transcript_9316/g.11227  ORF Transcript_9316/g.11227 Transcript_9316/m.11227 type:complete len:93 (-) Transcript_9316:113-391(-)